MSDRVVVIMLFDGVDLLDVTGPPEVFSLLRREPDAPWDYRVLHAAQSLEPVTTSAGVRILPDLTYHDAVAHPLDTLIVPGSVAPNEEGVLRALAEPQVVAWAGRLAQNARRVASVCVGAHILAAAGLLEGKRATTHWSTADQLAAEHPTVSVDADPIFINDAEVWTGAGLTACLDLTLALLADDVGENLAQRVARQLVMYLRRPSGQSQFSVPLEPISPSRRVAQLRRYVAEHAAEHLTVGSLAAAFHLSERQLARIFRQELGMTPAEYLESARVEIARRILETTDDTLEAVAKASGLRTQDTLTRAFRRRLNVTPSQYRGRFRLRGST